MARPRKTAAEKARRTNVTLTPKVRSDSDLLAFYRDQPDRSSYIESLIVADRARAVAELALAGRTLADVKREFEAARDTELIDLGEPDSVARDELETHAVHTTLKKRANGA